MTENISTRALISRVLTETDLADPREVALKVAAMVPEQQVQAILVDALVSEVRAVMGARRNAAMSNVFTPSRQPVRSAKVSGIRDWWMEMCAARIHVGSAEWRTLGECGDKELAFAEAERRADAEREVQRADTYAMLRKLLRKYEVKTVADLPRDAVQAVAA